MGLQFYIIPCIVPLIVGLGVLADMKSPYARLLALLTLKPVVGTSLWLFSQILLQDRWAQTPLFVVELAGLPVRLAWQTLLPLPLIGVGLTVVILWRCRAALPTISRLTFTLLLTLDTLRWGSTYLVDLTRFHRLDIFVQLPMAMPTIFAAVAWLLWLWSRRPSLQREVS